MSTPEDQIDTGQSPGVLSLLQAPSQSPEGRAWGSQYLKAHPGGIDTSGEQSLLQDFAANAQEAREALRQARERLMAQAVPSEEETRAQMMAGNMAHDPINSPSGTVGRDLASRVAALQARRQAEQNATLQGAGLQEQMSAADQQVLKARLALQELKERGQLGLMNTALRATAKPDATLSAESPVGKMVEDRLGRGSLQTDAGRALFDKLQQQQTQIKMHVGAANLTDEQNDALMSAINEGRLDPAKVNSRTASLYASLELRSPGVNFNKMTADAALQRNAAFQQKAMTLETLPPIMQHMTDLGKKLGYSDERTVGKMQAFLNGELNDPAYTEYMSVRNDALMNIASVMRGVGMSDQAHRAEMEAAAPTMSPGALDGWLKGQMSSLQPRMERYRQVTQHGEKTQPPSTATGTALTATPAATIPSLDDINAELAKRGVH